MLRKENLLSEVYSRVVLNDYLLKNFIFQGAGANWLLQPKLPQGRLAHLTPALSSQERELGLLIFLFLLASEPEI